MEFLVKKLSQISRLYNLDGRPDPHGNSLQSPDPHGNSLQSPDSHGHSLQSPDPHGPDPHDMRPDNYGMILPKMRTFTCFKISI